MTLFLFTIQVLTGILLLLYKTVTNHMKEQDDNVAHPAMVSNLKSTRIQTVEEFATHRLTRSCCRRSKLGFLFSPTEFETQAEVSFVQAIASTIANRQRFHEAAAIDVLVCVRNRVVRRIRDVEGFDTEL